MFLVRASILMLIQVTGLTMAAEQSSQGISLSTDATEFVVGGSIPIKLAYKNTTAAQVAFKEPLKTWEAQFRVVSGDTPPQDRPFGKLSSYTTPAGVERRTVEAAKLITLEPRDEVTFDYDVGARWPELFLPGVVHVSVVDLNGDPWRAASNELNWRIVFTPESVDHLLAILGGAKSSLDSKQFAMHWLHTLNAGFLFSLEQENATTTRANKAALKSFRTWWAANRNTDDVAKQLAAINRAK
jgi:hypothetical protein